MLLSKRQVKKKTNFLKRENSSCTGWIGSIDEDQRKEYDRHDECHGFVIMQ